MAPDRTRQTRRRFQQGSLVLAGLGLVSGCGGSLLPWQQPAKVPRLGILQFGTLASNAPARAAFGEGLRDLGYVEGQNIAIDHRYAEDHLERMPDLAAELVALHPDLILVTNTEAVRAVQQLSSTVPMVFPAFQDPVENGLVASLARPGGNVTGLAITAGLEATKRLDLLKQAVPGISRVVILWDRPSARRYQETVVAAQTLAMPYLSLEVPDSGDLETVLTSVPTADGDGLIVMGSFRFSALAPQLVTFAATRRLPAMYSITTSAPHSGLLAYAPSILDNYRRAAAYVDKILKGAKPADLPIELPSVFHFIINLKTAQALGLTIPQAVLRQATEIIQ